MADAQGLSYYGATTLSARLHLSMDELGAARSQLIDLDLVAYQAPLYQVLALSQGASRRPPRVDDWFRASSFEICRPAFSLNRKWGCSGWRQ